VALGVERRLRVQSRRSGAKACLLEVNAGVAERLTAGGRLKALEKETGRRIFLEGSSSVAVDAFRILAEGSAEQVKGQRIPVSEGQEVEVELEFALTYSPRDAVGYVDGYMVIVEGGRNFLGERRKVRIDGTSRTGASAVLTGGRGGGGG
jgi:predicted RNA-binding protein with TRAM domain